MNVSLAETYPARTLVVDRDPLAAALHCAYVDAIDGFLACGNATTSRGALTLAGLRRPDVVLLDLSLDDAAALLQRLPPLPIVGVTSVNSAHEAVALRPYVSSLLLEPFLLETLRERLERCARLPLRR